MNNLILLESDNTMSDQTLPKESERTMVPLALHLMGIAKHSTPISGGSLSSYLEHRLQSESDFELTQLAAEIGRRTNDDVRVKALEGEVTARAFARIDRDYLAKVRKRFFDLGWGLRAFRGTLQIGPLQRDKKLPVFILTVGAVDVAVLRLLDETLDDGLGDSLRWNGDAPANLELFRVALKAMIGCVSSWPHPASVTPSAESDIPAAYQ